MSICYNTEYDCKIFKFLCNQMLRKVVFMTHELVSATLPVWSIIPFAGMLLSIAIVPLVRPEWWEKHMLGAAIAWSLLFLIPFAAAYGVGESWFRLLESVLLDYIPFIVLLFGLFVVAGGIAVRGTLAGTTKINCLLLFIGTFLVLYGVFRFLIEFVRQPDAHVEHPGHKLKCGNSVRKMINKWRDDDGQVIITLDDGIDRTDDGHMRWLRTLH